MWSMCDGDIRFSTGVFIQTEPRTSKTLWDAWTPTPNILRITNIKDHIWEMIDDQRSDQKPNTYLVRIDIDHSIRKVTLNA